MDQAAEAALTPRGSGFCGYAQIVALAAHGWRLKTSQGVDSHQGRVTMIQSRTGAVSWEVRRRLLSRRTWWSPVQGQGFPVLEAQHPRAGECP